MITRAQLIECGVTGREIERRVESGEYERIHQGVYRLGSGVSPHAREAAAVLACAPGAALGHRAAAYISEILPYPAIPGPIDVIVVGRHSGPKPGIVVHRTNCLRPDEVTRRHGIPVTSPARTLIDLAACVTEEELEQAVAEAFALRLTGRARLLRAIERARGRRGAAVLRTLLDADVPPARLRSRAEKRLRALIRGTDIPEPEVNARVGRWEVDFLWKEQRLAVETDRYGAHSSPWAFERDRRKAAELEDKGLVVRRISDRQLAGDPATALRRLRRDLGLGSP